MNWTRLLAVGLLVAGVAVAQDKKADDKAVKAELKKLEGTWKATSAEMSGQAFTPKDVGMEKVRIKGTKLTFITRVKGKDKEAATDKEVATFEITIAPAKKPKHMDWVKDKKSITLPCIYELKGDELRLCFPLLPGKEEKVKIERPEKLETKDKPVGLLVLKREKS
jgi:uncharacterized protein (TIGR03067 family)